MKSRTGSFNGHNDNEMCVYVHAREERHEGNKVFFLFISLHSQFVHSDIWKNFLAVLLSCG